MDYHAIFFDPPLILRHKPVCGNCALTGWRRIVLAIAAILDIWGRT
jgi:hypothetical protein